MKQNKQKSTCQVHSTYISQPDQQQVCSLSHDTMKFSWFHYSLISLPKSSLPPGTIRPWPMHTTCMHTTVNSGLGRSTLDLRSMLSYLLCSLAKQHRKQHSEGANWCDSACCEGISNNDDDFVTDCWHKQFYRFESQPATASVCFGVCKLDFLSVLRARSSHGGEVML